MAIELIEPNGAHWIGRRTSGTGMPERGLHFRLAGWRDSQAMPGIIGFYAASIDDARSRLNMGA